MSKNDEKIKELLEVISTKREELGSRPRMSLKTNGLLSTKDTVININTINDIEGCVATASLIIRERDLYNKAAELLGVKTLTSSEIAGFPAEDWIDDIKLKASTIKWSLEDKKIKSMEKKLKDLRSEDQKTADELDSIAGDLGI
jgi:hypothetical protein